MKIDCAIKLPAAFRFTLIGVLMLYSISVLAQDSSGFRVAGSGFEVSGSGLLPRFVIADRINEPETLNPKPETRNPKRIWLVAGAHAAFWAGSYIALDKAWYADYPKEKFHFFNDNREWNQMDKAGHLWTTYQVSRISGGLWKWTGLSHSQSAWLGGISGIAYQSIIEIQDGFSSEWGFSPVDMVCNVTGAALYVGQELGWKEQRISLKLSYWPYDYETPQLKARRNQLFGSGAAERLLKEYNSQTIWLSANLKSFLPQSNLPKWLNIAVGYSSDGLYGGRENTWTDAEGNEIDRTDIPRVRQFFISPDIDLTKINTRSKFFRTVLSVVNCLKIPAPAIELNSKGKFKAHAIYY